MSDGTHQPRSEEAEAVQSLDLSTPQALKSAQIWGAIFKNMVARTMSSYAIAGVVVAMFTLHPSTAAAQACSSADDQVRGQFQRASLAALSTGNLNGYSRLQESLPGRLSSSCRSQLNRLEPVRVNCTAQEKNEVLQHFQASIQTVLRGDVLQVFAILDDLEASVSGQCWLASMRHTDPRVVNACTGAEMDHMASFASPILRATRAMLTTGDLSLAQLSLRVLERLSQNCIGALAQLQAEAQQPQNQATASLPGVLDHGRGGVNAPIASA